MNDIIIQILKGKYDSAPLVGVAIIGILLYINIRDLNISIKDLKERVKAIEDSNVVSDTARQTVDIKDLKDGVVWTDTFERTEKALDTLEKRVSNIENRNGSTRSRSTDV